MSSKEEELIRERRIDMIGRNGNDGLHYESLSPEEAYELAYTTEFTESELKWIKKKARKGIIKALGIGLIQKLLSIEKKAEIMSYRYSEDNLNK
tara:strand:- start:330 stop:611 length:282 start_codon:yes stop_codon:yes gene_type:complete